MGHSNYNDDENVIMDLMKHSVSTHTNSIELSSNELLYSWGTRILGQGCDLVEDTPNILIRDRA
jgi:hypothetical protein